MSKLSLPLPVTVVYYISITNPPGKEGKETSGGNGWFKVI